MKRNGFLTVLGALLCMVSLLSCSIGLQPAWKEKGKTAVSLKFSVLPQATALSSSRAVAEGGGYLYIRTLGGPTGSKGPNYGPFTIAPGGEFKTTDIPAGTYSKGFAILFASDPIDGIQDILNLEDDDFINAVSGSAFVESVAQSTASGFITGEFDVNEGQNNSLSVTLVPFVGAAATVNMADMQSYTIASADQNALTRKFLKLIEINAPSGVIITELVCQTSGGAVSRMVLFDEDGNPLPNQTVDDTSTIFKADYMTGSTFYLYIECTGAEVHLSFHANTVGGNVSVSISGAAASAGKNIFYYIMPVASTGNPVGFGSFTIAPDGTGIGSVNDSLTGYPATIPAGSYNIFAYIDMNENTVPGDWSPDEGEPALSSTVNVTASATTIALVQSGFNPFTPYPGYAVYYVSNLGGGDASGSSPSNTGTLDAVLTAINNNGSTQTGPMNWVVLTEDISRAVPTSIMMPTKKVTITSQYKGPAFSITLGYAFLSGPFISVIASSYCALENVTVSGTPYMYAAPGGLVSVIASGTFVMKKGARLEGNYISNSGGGVSISGGSFIMEGGTINNCSSSGSSGGGVYIVDSGSGSFIMTGGTISNCSAYASGGGVGVGGDSFTMTGGTITGNQVTMAGSGGGVHVGGGSLAFGGDAVIFGNSAPSSGGGMYLAAGVAFSFVAGSPSITGNKIAFTNDIGTGVFITGNAAGAASLVPYVTGNYYNNGTISSGTGSGNIGW